MILKRTLISTLGLLSALASSAAFAEGTSTQALDAYRKAAADKCGTDPKCYNQEIIALIPQGKQALYQALTVFSPSIKYSLEGLCKGRQNMDLADCEVNSLRKMNDSLAKVTSELDGIQPGDANVANYFKGSLDDRAWVKSVYEEVCKKQSKTDALTCLRDSVKQLKFDVPYATEKMTEFRIKANKADSTSKVMCAKIPDRCAQTDQFHLGEMMIPSEKHPKYQPRRDPALAAVSGSGGASAKGAGHSEGGTRASSAAGEGEGDSKNLSKGSGDGEKEGKAVAKKLNNPAANLKELDKLRSAGGSSGSTRKCPSYIPRVFCGGGKYDPTLYRKYTQDHKVEADEMGKGATTVRTETFKFEPVTDVNLGGTSVNDLNEISNKLFPTIKGDFVQDLTDFQGELLMEKYLEAAYMADETSQGYGVEGLNLDYNINRLAESKSISCITDGPVKAKSMLSKAKLWDGKKLADSKLAFRKRTVKGAQCMSAVQKRRQELSKRLGFDQAGSRAVITDKDIKDFSDLVGGNNLMAKLTGDNEAGTPVSWSVEQILKLVANAPVLRQLLHEAPVMNNLVEASKRECGGLQGVGGDLMAGAAAQKRRDCSNLFAEYLVLTQELDTIYESNPLLQQKASDSYPVYERIADAAGSNPKLANYTVATPDGQSSFCMERVAGDTASEKGIKAVDEQLSGRLATILKDKLFELESLCKNKEGLAKAATHDAGLMNKFFDCKRPRFASLQGLLGVKESIPAMESDAACRNRQDSNWLACQLYAEKFKDEDLETVKGQSLQMGFDILMLASPGLGRIGGAGLAARMSGGAVVGAAFGGATTLLTDTEGQKSVLAAQRGLSSGMDQSVRLGEELDKLAKSDSKIMAVVEGAFVGMIFGSMGEGHGGKAGAKGAAKTELSIAEMMMKHKNATPEMAAKIEAGLIRTAEQLEAADFKLAEAKSRMNKLLEKPLEHSDPKKPQTMKEIANLKKMITALEDGRANQAAAKKTMNQILEAAIKDLDPELYSEASLVENAEKVKALRQMIAQEPKEALQLMRYLQEGNDPRNIRKFMSELANGKSCPKGLAEIQALAKSTSVNLARIAF